MKNKFLYIKEQCKECGGKGYRWSGNRAYRGEQEKDVVEQCNCLKKMILYNYLDSANVPREYYGLNMDDFKETTVDKVQLKKFVTSVIADPNRFFNEGRNIFFYGPNGTGKTMLAVEILKAAINNKHSIYYDFYPIICEEFSKKGYKADDVKERYDKIFSTVDFLVIDEMCKESDCEDNLARRLLEIHILKKRGGKPTILLGNLYDVNKNTEYSIDQARKAIGDRYGISALSMLGKNWHFKNAFDADARGGN